MAVTRNSAIGANNLTYDDLVSLPDDGNRYEILDGDLVVTPPPLTRHQIVSLNLTLLLCNHVRERALGRVLAAPTGVILAAHTAVQPDILFISSSRSTIIQRHAVVGAPDLVVEILSPSTASRDRNRKAKLYARFGVRFYWIVEPDELSLETFSLEAGAYTANARQVAPTVVYAEPFPDLALDLGALAD